MIDMLAENGNLLWMPHSRSLGEGLFELRFHCGGVAKRITYCFLPSRRVVLLTVFRKQRQNEQREINRARDAMSQVARLKE